MNPEIDKKDEIEKGIIGAEISGEMRKAYIDYAMSVIVARALPSVEDGLKPVHRRILYAMNQMGLQPGKQTKKSARIVGDVIGKFHPHGDIAVYDALVRMAQDFSLRYPLVHGQGNFGSLDGDKAAAYRYTEAKLASISTELLQDIDKQTVKFLPNFDNSLKEPETLPGKLPNLLLNGASGIAVGMATNIPPHNLNEVSNAIIKLIEKPDITIEKLCNIIKGPDFPTGSSVTGDMIELYKTGNGQLTIRGKTTTETIRKKEAIVITEIPYLVNKADLVKQIANLVQNKKLPDIKDLRDESAKGKVRIVIELRRGADSKFTINRLYKYTRLQDRFNVNIIALVKGQPKQLNLKQILEEYINYRKLIITRRTKYLLKKAEERLEIVNGLIIALKNIDEVIFLIKKSSNITEALDSLIKKFRLSKKQAEAVLQTRLQTLSKLETDKLKKEEKELQENIKEYNKILESEGEILSLIRKDLLELKRKYGDNRKTTVLQSIKELKERDLVHKKDVVITITDKGYVKRMDIKTYKEQKRGGRGVIGSGLATGDFVNQIMTCSTHDYILLFTDKGRVYWLKAYKIPAAERYSKGRSLVNLIDLKNENITTVMAVKRFENYLFMATKKGIVKKISLNNFSKPRSTGVKSIKLPLDDSDRLIGVRWIKEGQEILLITKKGQACRFNSNDVRAMGRASYGVAGIKLNKGDEVVSMQTVPLEKKEHTIQTILSITERGYGKRSKIEDYRLTNRAGKGVINIKTTQKNGDVKSTVTITDKDSVILTTEKGMVIRMSAKDIRVMGRATQGVRIVKLQPEDRVSYVVRVVDNGEVE